MSVNLRRYLKSRGVIEAEMAVKLAHEIALDLALFHSHGRVYGRLAPYNVWLSDDIKASLLDPQNSRPSLSEYQAPDQGPPADIYVLGLILYEMLTGWPTFDGSTPPSQARRNPHSSPEVDRTIPPALDALILRCLEHVPEKRFQDGFEVANALESL